MSVIISKGINMSKKNKRKSPETTIEDFYDLKVDKVDELVAALKGETTSFQEDVNYAMNASMGVYDPQNVKRSGKDKEFDPYKNDFLGKIPTWLKAIFIKFWFAGMVCYFTMMGLMLQSALDQTVLTGVVLGLVTELFVNSIFRFMESDKREYNAYMMFPFPFKAYWTFFTNILYYVLVGFAVAFIYNSLVANAIVPGVEPLLFGVITVAVDMLFIGAKDGVVALVNHIIKKRRTA